MSIVLRATLHQAAPNTYYGQWPRKFAQIARRDCRSIARKALVQRAPFHSFWLVYLPMRGSAKVTFDHASRTASMWISIGRCWTL